MSIVEWFIMSPLFYIKPNDDCFGTVIKRDDLLNSYMFRQRVAQYCSMGSY